VLETRVTDASADTVTLGTAEEIRALTLARSRLTLGADKGYDAADFVADLLELNVTPHVAQNTSGRRSEIDDRTTRRQGYEISQRKRKRVEEIFGWAQVVGLVRKNAGPRITACRWYVYFRAGRL
jgi:hypothetical protein